jgi:hypothetical protein
MTSSALCMRELCREVKRRGKPWNLQWLVAPYNFTLSAVSAVLWCLLSTCMARRTLLRLRAVCVSQRMLSTPERSSLPYGTSHATHTPARSVGGSSSSTTSTTW